MKLVQICRCPSTALSPGRPVLRGPATPVGGGDVGAAVKMPLSPQRPLPGRPSLLPQVPSGTHWLHPPALPWGFLETGLHRMAVPSSPTLGAPSWALLEKGKFAPNPVWDPPSQLLLVHPSMVWFLMCFLIWGQAPFLLLRSVCPSGQCPRGLSYAQTPETRAGSPGRGATAILDTQT